MSVFVEHKPCPKCGSRDNLAVYTDHEYCFGCSYVYFYNYHPLRDTPKQDKEVKVVSLPEDIAPYIPAVADSWIRKYDLTTRELLANRVVWSEYRKLLIFPYFDDKNFLWGWQGRYFGDDPNHPKWTGKGNFKQQTKIYGLTKPRNNVIIIVEDIVSTIKLSRIYNTICLYGSHIDISKYINIYNIYKPSKYIIWLDKDKRKESYQYSYNFSKLGIPSSVIVTDLDPKEYSTDEHRRIIEP